MSVKKVSPLNNPSSKKSSSSTSINTLETRRSRRWGVEKGVSKGGKEGGHIVEALVRCEMCGEVNKIVFGYGKLSQTHKCIGCTEIQPIDGYRVIMFGSHVPTVLSTREVEARQLIRERVEKGV